jgi:hypothetical protein
MFSKQNLGKFWSVLQWKMLVYFMDVWSILRSLGIFMDIWYISNLVYFSRFGILYQEKSGNPVPVSLLSDAVATSFYRKQFFTYFFFSFF